MCAGTSRLRIGALDETGRKKGQATAGVQRQHMGCANSINSVHLAFVVERTGHALIAHRLWLPAFQLADALLRQAMGLPERMRRARTKGRIAIDMLAEAYRDGVTFDFVTGDYVYGACPILRAFMERIGQPYVLRVAKTFTLDFGLDQSQVRTWTANRRHANLVCAALAVAAATAARLQGRTDRRARPDGIATGPQNVGASRSRLR